MKKKISLFLAAFIALVTYTVQAAIQASEPEVYAVAEAFTPTNGQVVQATTSVKLTYGVDGKWAQSASPVLDAAMGYYVVGGNNPKFCFKLKGLEPLCLYSIKKY